MPDRPTLNGQVIGQAERATRGVLELLLAETDTPFDSWIALRFLGLQGDLAATALVGQLVVGLRIEEFEAELAVDFLVDEGLAVRGDDVVSLTVAGHARFTEINDGANAIAARLYRDLPTEDLVVARRVLETLTERARAELAAA